MGTEEPGKILSPVISSQGCSLQSCVRGGAAAAGRKGGSQGRARGLGRCSEPLRSRGGARTVCLWPDAQSWGLGPPKRLEQPPRVSRVGTEADSPFYRRALKATMEIPRKVLERMESPCSSPQGLSKALRVSRRDGEAAGARASPGLRAPQAAGPGGPRAPGPPAPRVTQDALPGLPRFLTPPLTQLTPPGSPPAEAQVPGPVRGPAPRPAAGSSPPPGPPRARPAWPGSSPAPPPPRT